MTPAGKGPNGGRGGKLFTGTARDFVATCECGSGIIHVACYSDLGLDPNCSLGVAADGTGVCPPAPASWWPK